MLCDHLFQGHTVRAIKVMIWGRVFAEVQHFTQALAADSVRQIMPVSVQPVFGTGLAQDSLETRVPIQDRAARIKRQGSDIR
jgi:hypothetical protein